MLSTFLFVNMFGSQLTPSAVVSTNTWATLGSANRIARVGNHLLVQNSALYCVDLQAQKQVWSYSHPNHSNAQNLAVVGSRAYATFESSDSKSRVSTIVELDVKTGKRLRAVPCEGSYPSLTSDGTALYYLDPRARLVALNSNSLSPKWRSAPLTKKRESYVDIEGLARFGNRVVFNYANTTFCLDAAKGTTKWSEPESYFFGGGRHVACGDRVLVEKNGLTCKSLATGKTLWQKPGSPYSETTVAHQNQFILSDHSIIRCISAENGTQVWKSRGVPDPYDRSGSSGFSARSGIFGDLMICESDTHQVVMTLSGKEVSHTPVDKALNIPIWRNGSTLATFDGSRVRWYRPGTPITAPTNEIERIALAKSLSAKYPDLDRHDYSVLRSLTPQNFAPMLDRYLALSREEVAHGEYYANARDLGRSLYELATKEDAELIATKLRGTKKDEDCRVVLLSLLAKVGDPDKVVPFFLDALNQKTPGFELYESETFVAREYVSQSTHPLAVKYLVDLLRNPKADETQRGAAYVTLAGKSEEATEEVRKQKRVRKLLKPMVGRFELADLGKTRRDRKTTLLLKTHTTKGTEWGLMSSSILGNYSDLFIARKVGGKWQRPVFLGVSGEPISRWVKPAPPEPTVLGHTGKSLIAGKWVTLISSIEKLATDTDGDGYRDLEEARLGTDPKSADMDGDGDRDELDPFPNVAKRPHSEDELALAAAYEGRYHFFDNEGPALLTVPSLEDAFEMTGWGGPVIVRVAKGDRDWSHPLDRCYEYGVGMIGLGGSGKDKRTFIEQAVDWDAKHEVATVNISTYYGGLNGTGYVVQVKKFGSDWLVISSRMAYIS
ncbi:MAG: PQQ-binding-like beta-propeller repeat protein [Armatimonadota bacterium]